MYTGNEDSFLIPLANNYISCSKSNKKIQNSTCRGTPISGWYIILEVRKSSKKMHTHLFSKFRIDQARQLIHNYCDYISVLAWHKNLGIFFVMRSEAL